jgi:hypothetical protein
MHERWWSIAAGEPKKADVNLAKRARLRSLLKCENKIEATFLQETDVRF